MGLLGSTCSQPAIATAMGLIGAYDAGCTSTGSYAIINQSIYQLINYQTLQNPRAGREGTGKVNAVNPPVSRREEAGGARRAEGANHCARRHRARETLRGQFGQLSRDSGDPRNGIERDCSPAKAARTSAIETAARVSARPLPRAYSKRSDTSSSAFRAPPPPAHVPATRFSKAHPPSLKHACQTLASTCHCRVIGVGANRSLRRRMYKYGILCHY